MLLYNSDFKLLGMSWSALNLVGYHSFGSFCASNSDISDLFLTQNEQDSHYIESLLKSDKPLNVDIKDKDGKAIKTDIYLEKINDSEYYLVFLSASGEKESINKWKTNIFDKKYSSSFLVSNIFRQSFNAETERLEKEKFHNNINKDSVDMEWFLFTLKELGIDESGFLNMLDELVKYSDENSEILHESLIFGDKKTYSPIFAKIKDTSSTLDIKPLLKCIYKLENSQISEISVNFREYQGIITEIKKIINKRNAS